MHSELLFANSSICGNRSAEIKDLECGIFSYQVLKWAVWFSLQGLMISLTPQKHCKN